MNSQISNLKSPHPGRLWYGLSPAARYLDTMPLLRCCFGLLISLLAFKAAAAPDLKFDVFTFSDTNSQAQFDHLNYPTTNGHYIAMGGDTHRLELATNGNALAIYYNTFNDGY